MSKICKIYYGTVINEDGDNWAGKGTHNVEPIKVEGEYPLGKSPDFCCEKFEAAWRQLSLFGFFSDSIAAIVEVRLYAMSYSPMKISFCPFCGGEIVLIENLKLKAIRTPRTINEYYFEIV
jgi:hypothetical protein